MKKKIWKKNLLLCAAVVLIAASPLWLKRDAAFEGADGQAMDAVAELNPTYQQWASPLITPPSGEVESLLFAVQAALGAGVLGFILGRMTGKGHQNDRD